MMKAMTALDLCGPFTVQDQLQFIQLSGQVHCFSEVNSKILCVREEFEGL